MTMKIETILAVFTPIALTALLTAAGVVLLLKGSGKSA